MDFGRCDPKKAKLIQSLLAELETRPELISGLKKEPFPTFGLAARFSNLQGKMSKDEFFWIFTHVHCIVKFGPCDYQFSVLDRVASGY